MKRKEVSVIAAFKNGKILWGKRKDNNLWTNPGGHLEKGERPIDGAARELFEETGIKMPVKAFKHLKTEDITTKTGLPYTIYAFTVEVPENIASTIKNDPDNEVYRWHWMSLPLSEEVMKNLHSPDNVILKAIGMQKESSLSKTAFWKGFSKQAKDDRSYDEFWRDTDKENKQNEKKFKHHIDAVKKIENDSYNSASRKGLATLLPGIIGSGALSASVASKLPNNIKGKALTFTTFLGSLSAAGLLSEKIKDRYNKHLIQTAIKNKEESDKDFHRWIKNGAPGYKHILTKQAKELIPGGVAEGITDEQINKEDLKKGEKVELEHTPRKDVAREIARDHIVETGKKDSDGKIRSLYYDKLIPMEKELEKKAVKITTILNAMKKRLDHMGVEIKTPIHNTKQTFLSLDKNKRADWLRDVANVNQTTKGFLKKG